MKATVSLQIIVKDEVDQVTKLVQSAYPFFDEINLTVSNKTAANKLQKNLLIEATNVKYREWNNNFADARNANYALSTTDYTFWLDADDTFDFSAIPEMVAIAQENQIDAVFLPYNYAHDERGNIITRHWRERLVVANKGFIWRGAVHETYLTEQDYVSHKIDNPVVHLATPDHAKESLERNHVILVNAVESTDEPDPRDLCYLGASYFSRGEYMKCIETLTDYLEVGGSMEDAYRSLTLISEACYHLNMPERALEYASKCITMKPEYPMGYWLLAQYEADQEKWKEALEWVKVSMTKPDPNTLSVYDPSSRERAILIAAQADFMLGNFNKALEWLRRVPKNPNAIDLMEHFQSEADAEAFTVLLPKIRKFFKNDSTLFYALTPDIAYDKRIRELRNLATEPIKWGDKSIVIFCGQGYEEWGPHTLDQGMGGSEEAVVYLAPELAKLGYSVYVFGEVPKHIYKDGADWYPWQQIDTRDEFNIFVSWRNPQFLERITARVKLCDVHDVLPEQIMKDYPDVTYMVKSAYHRSLTPKLPDDKFRIIGNGISKEQFND